MKRTMFAICVGWSAAMFAASTNLVSHGYNAGAESDGMGNIAFGNWAFARAGGTNTVAIGSQSAYKAQGAMRSVFIGDGAGEQSTNLVRCIAIGPGEMSGEANLTNVVSIGGRIVMADGMMWITPDAHKHSIFAPLFWIGGNLALSAERDMLVSAASNIVMEASGGIYVTNAVLTGVKSCDWTPRMVVEDGALQVYTNGVKVGSIPLSGN